MLWRCDFWLGMAQQTLKGVQVHATIPQDGRHSQKLMGQGQGEASSLESGLTLA